MTDSCLVSVIIPAYNAASTIDETLLSVRGQSWRNLEIIVVDDGSSDETATVAQRHAEVDPRIRVIRQANGGVAAARNHGIAESCGQYLAPLDADDLWRPDKIARQMERMTAGAGRIGLVYTWFALIDAASDVILLDGRSEAEGQVLEALALRNIVGNGSSPLMLRTAVEAAGGYDPGLRAAGAQGCEDYKLYFAIAERYEFALVRDYLTGYRDLPQNMSADLRQMLRSRDLCASEIVIRHPRLARPLQRGRARLIRFMLSRAMRTQRFREVGQLLLQLMRGDKGAGLSKLLALAIKVLRRKPAAGARLVYRLQFLD